VVSVSSTDLQVAFGEVIRVLRHLVSMAIEFRAGFSQEELSFRCDRHRTYVTQTWPSRLVESGVAGDPCSAGLMTISLQLAGGPGRGPQSTALEAPNGAWSLGRRRTSGRRG
jgi:hypothetical protein